eukprot:COSAG06_NODE_12112_length_1422_cov_1.843537_1_plen_142_part_01
MILRSRVAVAVLVQQLATIVQAVCVCPPGQVPCNVANLVPSPTTAESNCVLISGTIAADIEVSNNPNLVDLDFSAVTTVDGSITIHGNPNLRTTRFDQLVSVTRSFTMTSNGREGCTDRPSACVDAIGVDELGGVCATLADR